MALQLSLSHQTWSSNNPNPMSPSDPTRARLARWVVEPNPNRVSKTTRVVAIGGGRSEKKVRRVVVSVKANLDTQTAAETAAPAGKVTEVNKDSFWPIVNAALHKPVVLDMYTQWCGPCKVMAPKYQELAEKYQDVVFLKLDCNQENKPLAKELGIRVVPTFKILKGGKIVEEVTGAKFDKLVAAIETARSS